MSEIATNLGDINTSPPSTPITEPATAVPALRPADLQVIGDDTEPRVLDLRIAKRLGFGTPRNIRQLIERNSHLLKMHGKLFRCTVQRNQDDTPRVGRPENGYWLNEGQTVMLGFLSDAPGAVTFQAEVIAVWKAYRRGLLTPSSTQIDLAPILRAVGTLGESVTAIMNRLDRLEARPGALLEDRALCITHFSALQAIRRAGIGAKQGSSGGMARRIGNEWRRLYGRTSGTLRFTDAGLPKLADEILCAWQYGELTRGEQRIRTWAAERMARKLSKKTGQNTLKLVVPEPSLFDRTNGAAP